MHGRRRRGRRSRVFIHSKPSGPLDRPRLMGLACPTTRGDKSDLLRNNRWNPAQTCHPAKSGDISRLLQRHAHRLTPPSPPRPLGLRRFDNFPHLLHVFAVHPQLRLVPRHRSVGPLCRSQSAGRDKRHISSGSDHRTKRGCEKLTPSARGPPLQHQQRVGHVDSSTPPDSRPTKSH